MPTQLTAMDELVLVEDVIQLGGSRFRPHEEPANPSKRARATTQDEIL